MRMYPPAGSLFRECTKDYVFEELGVKIEKGTGILIPVGGIQNNPDYFPNPEVFRPERFLPEEKAKREQLAHMPFGEGPRICIGKQNHLFIDFWPIPGNKKLFLHFRKSIWFVAIKSRSLLGFI